MTDQIDINFHQVATPPDECSKHGKLSMGISQNVYPGKHICVDCVLEDQLFEHVMVSVPEGKIVVDESALRQVLQAIMGPPHLMRELVVLRNLGNSPIDKLIADYNSEIRRMNNALEVKNANKP